MVCEVKSCREVKRCHDSSPIQLSEQLLERCLGLLEPFPKADRAGRQQRSCLVEALASLPQWPYRPVDPTCHRKQGHISFAAAQSVPVRNEQHQLTGTNHQDETQFETVQVEQISEGECLTAPFKTCRRAPRHHIAKRPAGGQVQPCRCDLCHHPVQKGLPMCALLSNDWSAHHSSSLTSKTCACTVAVPIGAASHARALTQHRC